LPPGLRCQSKVEQTGNPQEFGGDGLPDHILQISVARGHDSPLGQGGP
jgi:hypothetical protein